ncbi:hypothetical protein DPSP01_013028 [Paraphaeosphaeria sporulosa]|uniref:Uncharacterized protein n=1 Tax=Paraphaeosphaeria sporulosa TaxID=1460663 RepID=A0A177CAN0_9PLEO|nr:uncharacterized protein CC84DRAFT_1177727 [Paraphaeosphaeria sporulosa]OAG03780.1 hypothetical protein CC84DRAFT_1177727 [Paraphaeosphaeria sporulosa]
MKTFTSALLTLGSVSTIVNAVAIDFYANRDCGLFSYSIDTPSEIGCTTLPETVSGLVLKTDIPDGDCLINLFNDESCMGNSVQNFLNGDTQTNVCLPAPQLYVAYSATGC